MSRAKVAKPIDLETPPVTRHILVRLDNQTHWLVRTTAALVQDGWSATILMNELATLYQAKAAGVPSPVPKKNALQYADYAVWHRSVMRPDGPAYAAMLDWWKSQFPERVKAAKVPFRRSRRLSDIDPSQGTIGWQLDEMVSRQLDDFARSVGATFFAARLACFTALLADMSGRSTVVMATGFDNRNRLETRNIVGSFANLVPLVVTYRRRASLRDWIINVRDRVFETEAHAELPYEELYEQLGAAGMKPPGARAAFFISGRFGRAANRGVNGVALSASVGQDAVGLSDFCRPAPAAELPRQFRCRPVSSASHAGDDRSLCSLAGERRPPPRSVNRCACVDEQQQSCAPGSGELVGRVSDLNGPLIDVCRNLIAECAALCSPSEEHT